MNDQERRQRIDRAYERGYQLEQKWGNCVQATMWAVREVMGVGTDNRDALRAISGFHGGGAGFCDGSCGAYVAGIYLRVS